jgi:type IV secretory pathway TrbL component
MDPNAILISATQTYIDVFRSYLNQFLIWGQWLFSILLVINLGWLWFWYAIDKSNIVQGLSAFLKKFFILMLFYTIMVNHHWLFSILTTTQSMGQTLTGIPLDPSAIIANGIMIANKILIPIEKSSLLTAGFGLFIALIVYLIIAFTFISIALDLALTLIIATALISLSTFFLGFAALGATSGIAKQSLNMLLAICMKLLGIYIVVGAGSKTIAMVTAAIPTSILSFDAYIWIIATILLFWLLAKNLPNQMVKIIDSIFQENQAADPNIIEATEVKKSALTIVSTEVKSTGLGITSSMDNAKSMTKTMVAASSSIKGFTSTGFRTVADHFKNLKQKDSI